MYKIHLKIIFYYKERTTFITFLFIINVGVRANLHASRLISQVIKLTIIQAYASLYDS
jgi:hypothetical protein